MTNLPDTRFPLREDAVWWCFTSGSTAIHQEGQTRKEFRRQTSNLCRNDGFPRDHAHNGREVAALVHVLYMPPPVSLQTRPDVISSQWYSSTPDRTGSPPHHPITSHFQYNVYQMRVESRKKYLRKTIENKRRSGTSHLLSVQAPAIKTAGVDRARIPGTYYQAKRRTGCEMSHSKSQRGGQTKSFFSTGTRAVECRSIAAGGSGGGRASDRAPNEHLEPGISRPYIRNGRELWDEGAVFAL